MLGLDRDCGPLLELGQLQRQFRLGSPVAEGLATIPVEQVVGTVSRAQDFDDCFQPLRPDLEKRLREIQAAASTTLDEPIDVIRVDRAYFVSDGHKRVAIARQSGRAFIDAQVSRLQWPYELTSDVDDEAIERTAREGEFRRHTGLAAALPNARFAVTDVGAYGELLEAVQAYAFASAERIGRLPRAADVAAEWYQTVYLPTVAMGRARVGRLIDSCTDADVFLAMHRQRRAYWGTDCDAAECAADRLLAEQRRAARLPSTVGRAIRRVRGRDRRPSLLPLASESGATESDPA